MAGLCGGLWPPRHKCAMCAHMRTSAALTKELLDPFNVEKQPGARIYHVSVQEKHTSGLIFFGWFPVEGKKIKFHFQLRKVQTGLRLRKSLVREFLFLSEGSWDSWQALGWYTYTRQTRLLAPFPVWTFHLSRGRALRLTFTVLSGRAFIASFYHLQEPFTPGYLCFTPRRQEDV